MHQNVFLRAIAVYTCACFIPVIVSNPFEIRIRIRAHYVLWLIPSTGTRSAGGGAGRGRQAIYPVLIIVIVALGWSPIERAISDAGDTTRAGTATLSDAGGPYLSMLAMRRDPNRAIIMPGRITVLADTDTDTDTDTASAQRCIQHDEEDSTVAVVMKPETKQGAVI